jgi:hypothetical protein
MSHPHRPTLQSRAGTPYRPREDAGSGVMNVETVTILVGRLPDQAALSGILKSLYDLHLPVVMAECVISEDCSN